jgi:lipoprotein-anchoring transpeptidase ErfK/SrfK
MTAISRRSVLLGAALLAAGPVLANSGRQIVPLKGFEVGSIVVKTKERRLYLVVGEGQAVSYPVAVGQVGKQWRGRTHVSGRYLRPAWSPPAVVKRDNPALPDVIAGGAPNNPMGEAALTLAADEYAIHGTNRPTSIGKAASYGCFRMFNEDILDLYGRVRVGTQVFVE